MIKYFRFSYDYILWGIGYKNLIMLLATIPVYKTEEEKKKEKDNEVVDFGDDVNALANYINNLK